MAVYDEAAHVLGCTQRHTVRLAGRWQRGTGDELVMLVKGNRSIAYRLRCTACGRQSTDVPLTQIKAWALAVADVEIRDTNTYDACVVAGCDQPGVDEHHFAPRNTFGDQADLWPTAALCRSHHVEWHRHMDGYRWHRARAAA